MYEAAIDKISFDAPKLLLPGRCLYLQPLANVGWENLITKKIALKLLQKTFNFARNILRAGPK